MSGLRRPLFVIASLSAAAFVLGPSPSPAAPTTHDVSITDVGFSPARLEVLAGDSVRWTNNGTGPHTSTSDSFAWDSGTLSPGQQFTFTFSGQAQLYRYHDRWNPNAAGEINVVGATPTPTSTPAPTATPTPTPSPGATPTPMPTPTPTPTPYPTSTPFGSPTPTPTPQCQPPRANVLLTLPAGPLGTFYLRLEDGIWQESNGYPGLQTRDYYCAPADTHLLAVPPSLPGPSPTP